MQNEYVGELVDDIMLSLEELTVSCAVSREWVVEHVQAGVLAIDSRVDAAQWRFGGGDLLRVRRMRELELTFDANPELAGLVADLSEELARLRARLRRAGLNTD